MGVTRKRNVQPLVNVNDTDVAKAAGEEVDNEVRTTSGAHAEGGAAEPLEREPPLADKRAGVAAGLGVEPPEDLDDELFGKKRVDPIMASHRR